MSTTDDAIEEGRQLALGYNGAAGPGFHNEGKKNAYECEACHAYLVSIDAEPGVTPFIIRRRNCGGEAQSKFYRVADRLVPTHEWTRPETLDGLNAGTIEHIRKGGLILQPISGNSDRMQIPTFGRVRRG